MLTMDSEHLRTFFCSGIALLMAGLCCLQVTGVVGVQHICYDCSNITNTSECTSLSLCKEGQFCYGERIVQGSDTYYNLGCASYDTCPDSTTTTSTTTSTTATTATIVSSSMVTANATTAVPRSTPTHAVSSQRTTDTGSTTVTPAVTTNDSTTPVIVATTPFAVPTTAHTPSRPSSSSTPFAGQPNPVGRSIADLEPEDPSTKKQCCYANTCNRQLFPETVDNSTCRDQIGYDCETTDAQFGICKKDPHHAKTVCRKFCDLCNLIDGHWSEWTNFSSCDVTCGNGTQVRHRNCSNPAPKNGGLNCTGNATEYQTCHPRDCPIHGGWSTWSEWTGCSVTCGVGLRVRDRNCSDPFPDPDGFYCFGRASDELICFDDYCEESMWSDWSSWSECTRTCGSGLKHRYRNCTGDTLFTKPCTGDTSETKLCNTERCSETQVPAFSASGKPREGEGNNTITLTNVITNVGNSYNSSTGKFTAPIGGLYGFFVTIEKQINVGQAYCKLMKNDEAIISIAARSVPISTDSYQQASNAAILHLDPDDQVYLGKCTAPVTMSETCAFSGILIQSG